MKAIFYLITSSFLLIGCQEEFVDNSFVEYKGTITDTLGVAISNQEFNLISGLGNSTVQNVLTNNNGEFSVIAPQLNMANLQAPQQVFLFRFQEDNQLIISSTIAFPIIQNQTSDLGIVQAFPTP